eukprot:TRINITY_DN13535_c0_g1_i2.p1 TRINITY_DN13535_c0_g1~~TRINITY_DN13535_c0_g1_i2.p1  ORF type:complete len:141 (-),score=17.62 TRINITY_DN13535_c0_g1_i2:1004-1426(-)
MPTVYINFLDKLFSDAAFKANEGYVSFGFVMMLNDVIVDVDAIKRPKVVSSEEAEAREVLAALGKAWKNGFDRLRILMDAQEVVFALKRGLDWSINSIILDIKSLVSLFVSVDFVFIPKTLNEQAHRLTKFCFFSIQDVD